MKRELLAFRSKNWSVYGTRLYNSRATVIVDGDAHTAQSRHCFPETSRLCACVRICDNCGAYQAESWLFPSAQCDIRLLHYVPGWNALIFWWLYSYSACNSGNCDRNLRRNVSDLLGWRAVSTVSPVGQCGAGCIDTAECVGKSG